jgi:bacterioferritin
MPVSKEEVIASLRKAYCMEVETVLNYLANSLILDGVRADFIKQALTADIQGELQHATQLGNRIKQLGGTVPGSLKVELTQRYMQPPEDTTDLVTVIQGVLRAENEAIEHYNKLIRLTEGQDYVTQELAITILADEEDHRQHFEGYLKEYTKK